MPRNILIDIIGRDNASPAFIKSAAAAETAAGRVIRAGEKMRIAGAKMSKMITLPVVAAAAASIKAATDYQKSLTLLQTAGGETVANMATVNAGIKKIAVSTGTSLGQLTEGMYIVEKAGIRGAAGLKVLKAGAQGAKAEGVDLSTAMNALTSVMMSYHLGADKAVQVQNMLVEGAGKAKTTMQEYAGALATVVPVASAAGIKFDQVAGAIATLTQHGTSAQEATQELAFTIRNLQAPNQVAQKAMQQLGLSVTGITKNLGKRGLTGTIDVITNAIAHKMGPAGLVAVSAFKKSRTAGEDLQTMLAKMPKNLAGISQQFLSGKIGMKEYQKDFKALGATGYAMGSQFLALTKTSRGFNDLIKSGQPQALTFAAYLKQVMGGAVGLNTALQLGGENMAYFNTATKDVGHAAAQSGADIATWAKTSSTMAVKSDILKAKVQVLAVNIGTKLLPIAEKIVSKISDLVDWFSNLSPRMQKTIGYSLAVAAAMGPVVSIVGRLTTGIGLLVRGGAAIGRWSITAVTSMYRIVQGARAAQLSIAAMDTRSYAAGLRIRSALGGAGAAGGSLATRLKGAAGKIGVAGAGIATVALVAKEAWDGFTKQSKVDKQAIDDLTGALLKDKDAIGANTAAAVQAALQKQGAVKIANKYGLSLQMLTDASMGSGAAQAALAVKIKALHDAHLISSGDALKLTAAYGGMSSVMQSARDRAAKIAKTIGTAGDQAATAASKVADLTRGINGMPSRKDITIALKTFQLPNLTAGQMRGGKGSQHARGGSVADGWFTVGEEGGPRGWELGYKQGTRLKFFSNKDARRMTGMNRLPGFAKGTVNTERIGSAIGVIGQAYTKPLDVASVGYPRIARQIQHAIDVLNEQIRKGLSKSAAASFRREITSLRMEANAQLGQLRLKIRGSDLAAVKAGLRGTVDDTRQAISTMLAHLRAVGISSASQTLVANVGGRLERAQGRLGAMRDYSGQIRSTLAGTFDSTKYGSITDLLNGFSSAAATNNSYASELNSLRGRAKGNSTLTAYINQLATSGQTATLQTLFGASKGELSQVTKDVGAYNASLSAGANAATMAQFNGQTVAGVQESVTELTGALVELAAAFGKAATRPIEIDKKVLADMTDEQLEAAIRHLTTVAKHGRKKH